MTTDICPDMNDGNCSCYKRGKNYKSEKLCEDRGE